MIAGTTLAPLLVGFAFGALLERTGLSRYERIVGIFRFEDLAVLKFLLSALVTASIGIRVVAAFGIGVHVPVPATYAAGNLLGGLVFGFGMALSGFCPGTVAAGAGEGRLDNLVAGGLGLYAGAIVYGLVYDRVMPALAKLGDLGAVTTGELLHAEPWLPIVVFAELTLLVFYAIERWRPARPGRARHGRGCA